jgi:hypothetical protein
VEQGGLSVVPEDEPWSKGFVEKDGVVLAEIQEVWQRVERLLRNVEKEPAGLLSSTLSVNVLIPWKVPRVSQSLLLPPGVIKASTT